MRLAKAEEISATGIGAAVGRIPYRLPPNILKFIRLFEV
jgi:hypothetical protein